MGEANKEEPAEVVSSRSVAIPDTVWWSEREDYSRTKMVLLGPPASSKQMKMSTFMFRFR